MKVQYYVLLWHWKWRRCCGSNSWTVSHPPQSTPMDKVPYINNPHYHRHRAKFLLIPNEQVLVPCQSMELFKQTKNIFLWEPRITPPSWSFKACLPQSLLLHCVSEHNFCVALCGMLWPPLGVWVCMINNIYQFHLLSVRFHVFGHLHNSRVKLSLSLIRWRAGNQNIVVLLCDYTKNELYTLK